MPGGWKLWQVGDAWTAADANTYLAHQVVPRFATVTARNSAISSPNIGQMAWCDDSDELYLYSGNTSTWVGAIPRVVFKTADKTITSSTTLTTDTDFTLALEASSWYIMKFTLFYVAHSSADIKFQSTYSGTASSALWTMNFQDINTTSPGPITMHLESIIMTTTPMIAGGVTGTNLYAHGTARFATTTAGNYNLQWAQNTSNATGSVLQKGSWMSCLKVK